MFGIGTGELIIVLIVVLIVIGPRRLPEVAKTVGKVMGEFKRATKDIQDELRFDDLLREDEPKKQNIGSNPPSYPPTIP